MKEVRRYTEANYFHVIRYDDNEVKLFKKEKVLASWACDTKVKALIVASVVAQTINEVFKAGFES